MENKLEMIQKAIKEAKFFAKQNGVKLHIYEENLIDDTHIIAKDYPNDIDLMTMQYKGYLVNVYIGNWDAFNEINDKWIDYDIYADLSCEEQINESYDIRGQNVLVAITDIQFYIDKIEEDIKKKGEVLPNKENVYLVYVISQHEGYCDTEVYKTSETACDAAEQLVFEYEQDGYTIMPNYTNINFARDIISGCCSIRVENENDEVEIIVEKKIVR
jgi:hypothetical protein